MDAFSLSYNPRPPNADGIPTGTDLGKGNCVSPRTDPPHWECLILGLGFFCLELLLPLLLFGIVWDAIGFPVLRLVGRCVYAILRLAAAGAALVIGTFVRLVPG